MRRACVLALLLSLFTSSQSRADVTVNVFDTGGNVRIEYSGTLDMSAVSFVDANVSLEEHRLRYSTPPFGQPFNSIIQLYNPPALLRTYTNAFSSAPGVYYIGNALVANSFGGNSLFLPTSSINSNATLRFDPADFGQAGNGVDIWSGSGFLQFDNTSIGALGINTATKTWVINNAAANRITMTVSAAPEPQSAFLLVTGIGLVALQSYRNRKRSAVRLL